MKKNITLYALLSLVLIISSCSSLPKDYKVEQVSETQKIAGQLMDQGKKLYDQANYSAALANYQTALEQYIGIDSPKGSILALLAIGKTELILGENESALENYYFAEEICLKEEIPVQLRNVYNHLADYYLQLQNYSQALSFCEKHVNLDEQQKNPVNSERLRIMGSVAKKQKELDLALEYYNQALQMDLDINHYANQASDYYLLASIYSLKEDYDTAMSFLLQALEKDKYLEYRLGVASDLTAMAKVALKQGDREFALYYYKKAFYAWKGLNRSQEMEDIEGEIKDLI